MMSLMMRMKAFGLKVIYAPGVNPLPAGSCGLLFLNLLLSGCTVTMPYSYLPQMMKTFGIPEIEVGYYAGWVASSLHLSRIFSSLVWGILVDKFNSKVVSVTANLMLSATLILFGFSYNFYWAFITRFVQGISMGLAVSGRTMLFEISDNTNQPYAMAVLTTASATGMMLGPSIGGFLILKKEDYPAGSLFRNFLFLLPNLLVGTLLAVGGVLMMIFLKNSKEITSQTDARLDNVESTSYGTASTVGLLKSAADINGDSETSKLANASSGRSKLYKILCNRENWLCNGLFLLYVIPSSAFAELFSVWAATDKIYRGLGYIPSEIGTQLMITASTMLVLNMFVSTRLTSYLGAKMMMVVFSLSLVLLYPLFPAISNIQSSVVLPITVGVLLLMVRMATSLAYVSITIWQSNSVTADLMGTANGLATTLACIGRAVAPIICGALYSWSLKNITSVNEYGLGFPFDDYLAFYFLSLCNLAISFWASLMPVHLNYRRVEM